MPEHTFVRFLLNQEASPVKRVNHTDGREYLVVPSVAIVEGVMNNFLYTEEEITAYIDAWNGRPLVIAHPQDLDGDYISANSPEIFARSPGFFFNAHFEDGRLKGDWWIDTAKAETLGGHAQAMVVALEAGKMFEQSTGLFSDEELTEGEFNGEKYEGIARNIRPDHIAILFDDVGACSIEDGCGAPRVNRAEEAVNDEPEQLAILKFVKSFASLLRKTDKNIEVRINADEEGGPDIGGEEEHNESEVNIMTREELLEALLSLETLPFTRAMLEAADDETLAAWWSQFGAAPEPMPEAGQGDDEDEDDEHPADNAGASAYELPTELEQLVTGIGQFEGGVEGVLGALVSVREQGNARMDELIGAVTTNSDQFTADELRTLPPEMLKKMAGLARSANITPNFLGRGAGINIQPDDEWEEWTPKEVQ